MRADYDQFPNSEIGYCLPARYRLDKIFRRVTLTGNESLVCVEGTAVSVKTGEAFEFTSLSSEAISSHATNRFVELKEQLDNDPCKWVQSPIDGGVENGYVFEVRRQAQRVDPEQFGRLNTKTNVNFVTEVLHLAQAVLRGLNHIHQKEFLHRQICRTSICKQDGYFALRTPSPLAFVAANQQPPANAIEFALYAAPELAGTIDQNPGYASDLYSLGVLLFQLMCGQPLFDGDNASSLLHKHVTCEPRWELLKHTPQIVIDLLQRLLRKSPSERYQTAAGVIHDIQEIVDALKNGEETSDIILGTFDNQIHSTESSSVALILQKRIEALPPNVRGVLTAASIANEIVDHKTLGRLAEMDEDEVDSCLKRLQKVKLLKNDLNGQLSFANDKIREATISRLNPAKRRELHFEFACHWEATQPSENATIAHQFSKANQPERALPHAIKAAEKARHSHAYKSAIELFSIAEQGIKHLRNREGFQNKRFEVYSGLAECLLLSGKHSEAKRVLAETERAAVTTEQRAWVSSQLGELCFKQGDKAGAIAQFESALAQLNLRVPKNSFQLLPRLGWEVIVQGIRKFLPKPLVGRSHRRSNERQSLITHVCGRLANSYRFVESPLRVLWANLRAVNNAERYLPSFELAQAYSDYGVSLSLIPWSSHGQKFAEQSFEIAKNLGSTWHQGQASICHAITQYAASKLEECIASTDIADHAFEVTFDPWGANIGSYHKAASKYYLGDWQSSVALCQTAYADSLGLGDFQTTGGILDVWARASDGEVPLHLIDSEKSRDVVDYQRECQLLLAEGVCRLKRNEYSKAVNCLEIAVNVSTRKGIVNAYTAPCFTWYVKALRLQLANFGFKTQNDFRKAKTQLLKRAKKACWIARRFQNERPLALHELGLTLNFLGYPKEAQQALKKGIMYARLLGMKGETFKLRESYCRLGRVNNWNNWNVYKDNENKQANKPEKEVSASVVDQFDTLLDSGLKILSTKSVKDVFRMTTEASEKLLRAQRAVIIKSNGDRIPKLNGAEFSTELVQEVILSHQTSTRNFATRVNQRITARKNEAAGSHICGPIMAGQSLVGVLYAKNDLISDNFGPESERIIEYLANAAGSALDKIDGYRQLEELNEFLESKVSERTATLESRSRIFEQTANQLKLTQVRLQCAHDEAQRANNAKSEFLARMSHEIRTPLSAIQGFTDLILRGTISDPDECREKLETVRSSSKHLVRLINELLDLSKVEADKLELECIDFSPAQIALDTYQSLHSKSQENNIDLELEFKTAIPESMVSDPTRIKQIVTNLLGNSIKFSENGIVRLEVSTCSVDDNLFLQFAVVDSGIGMSDEQLEKIFDPFVQADTSTTRKYGGSGLGLTVTKRLVDLLGGELTVESKIGKGSKFVVSLPIENREQIRFISSKQAQNVSPKIDESTKISADLSGIKILVADDTQINHELLVCILRDTNATLTHAMNGQEAVDAVIKDATFDLVLMDIQMPMLDGLAATAALRELGFDKPVIALTANKMKGDEEQYLNAGCSGYVSKPINIEFLMTTICEALSRQLILVDKDVEDSSKFDSLLSLHDCTDPWTHELPTDAGLNRLAKKFMYQTLNTDMFDLENLVRLRHADSITPLVHRLKGTSGSVGFETLSQIFSRLEDKVHDKDWSSVEIHFGDAATYVGFANGSINNKGDDNRRLDQALAFAPAKRHSDIEIRSGSNSQ